MFRLWIKKRSFLFVGVLLLCSSQSVAWVYGQDNSTYTEVGWQEPNIAIESRIYEFPIDTDFSVKIKAISDAEKIQLRIFRGNREKLLGKSPASNENCVTFSSAVLSLKKGNGSIRWGRVTPLWLALQKNGSAEELAKQEYFVRFEFKENGIPGGYLKLHKEAIKQYFGKENTGFEITVVPRLNKGMPDEDTTNGWISDIKKWLNNSRKKEITTKEITTSDCIQFVESQNGESLKIAKVFKCHDLRT